MSGPPHCWEGSILESATPLVHKPVFTVSRQFALNLVEDVFQIRVMAPYLTNLLSGNIRGIDNGLFVVCLTSAGLLGEESHLKSDALLKWKRRRFEEAEGLIGSPASGFALTVWEDMKKFMQYHSPWFFSGGLDDSLQKGYDVAVVVTREVFFLWCHRSFPVCPDTGG